MNLGDLYVDGFLVMVVVIAVVVIILLWLFFSFIPFGLWISAISAGVKVSIFSLVGMRLRRVKPHRVINPLIKGTKAGLTISQNQLESHLLSGGRVDNVVDALIAAHRANIELSFERAAAIDLAGRDVFEAVRMSVMPKIIETPMISAMAVNGIEIKALAKVTVRANIARLVGGAGEDTIIARVGEGIVTTIGSAKSHQEVLENPDRISQTVLNKGLDSGTAYEILSIDIADIDVGRNIGSQLQIDQAEADKRIAQAKAEERRATAIAREQEMKAQVEEMRSKVVEAEAQVPNAIADALRSGNMGVMDYLGMQNKIADTKMREGLAGININLGKPKDVPAE
ncbi:MAG: flotillin-like protein FloA [Defluviitaleaceae bacterium]|nr:flotillin-like protein FloA [Defluviitaleaceae bacterium]